MDKSQSLQLLRALFDHLDVAVLVADDHATYREANAAACRLLRRPREGVVGLHLSEIVVEGTRDAVDLQWRGFLRDGAQSGIFPLSVGNGVQVMTRFIARANVVPGLHCSFLSEVDSEPPADGTLLMVCAWTNRMLWNDRWVSLGEYLHKAHGVTVSHGICPDAFTTLDVPDEST